MMCSIEKWHEWIMGDLPHTQRQKQLSANEEMLRDIMKEGVTANEELLKRVAGLQRAYWDGLAHLSSALGLRFEDLETCSLESCTVESLEDEFSERQEEE